MVYDVERPPASAEALMISPTDVTKRKHFGADQRYEELLVPVFRGGERVYEPPTLARRPRPRAGAGRRRSTRRASASSTRTPTRSGSRRGCTTLRTRLILEARGEG